MVKFIKISYCRQQQASPNVSMLPNTNLAAKLPAVQHQPPRYFSVKDHHLLKPPHAMQTQGQISHLDTFYRHRCIYPTLLCKWDLMF